jgi:hypothetical protein
MTDNVVDLVDREEAIFRARLAGKSTRRIAREFDLDLASVTAIIERNTPTIDNNLRLITLQLELERLDEMQSVFYRAAVDGDVPAAAILLKIAERRSSYLGLDCPVRVDPKQLHEEVHPGPSSTEALLRELDRIAAERPAAGLNLSTGTPCPEPDAPDDPTPPPTA